MAKIYVTGDKHGEFYQNGFFSFLKNRIEKEDIVIILGDSGFNYYNATADVDCKAKISDICKGTIFCIHGNHDLRPYDVKEVQQSLYKKKEYCGGTVFYQEEFPNLLFAEDGSIFTFGKYNCLAIGGAYSIDKHYRLQNGFPFLWFPNEQPDEEIKEKTMSAVKEKGDKINVVLSHTCPMEVLPQYDTPSPDNSTEEFLSEVSKQLSNKTIWYCGHHHLDKIKNNCIFLYNDVIRLGSY